MTSKSTKSLFGSKIAIFVVASIAVALVLVFTSMKLYYSSDASRVDLSRPEYAAHRSKIVKDNKVDHRFEAQGPINKESLEDFLKKYNKEADKVTKVRAFSNDVLSDSQLGIE